MTYQSKSQAKRIEIMKNAEQSDHEKLSRKLEGLWHDSFKQPGYQALRAVVELHKPVFAIANGVEGPKYCQQCAEGRGYADYPCPTIQAIQEKLK